MKMNGYEPSTDQDPWQVKWVAVIHLNCLNRRDCLLLLTLFLQTDVGNFPHCHSGFVALT